MRKAALPHRSLLAAHADRRGLPRTLVFAIGWVESRFDSTAVSGAGAVGVMQIHPPTGGRLAWAALNGQAKTPSYEHLIKPEQNVRLGTTLLKMLLSADFFGDVRGQHQRQLLATAAYNCGAARVANGFTEQGTIEATVARASKLSPREVYDQVRATVPDETKAYVRKVFGQRRAFSAWKAKGERVYGIPPEE
jgi:soluble lytic murein transglycosylase